MPKAESVLDGVATQMPVGSNVNAMKRRWPVLPPWPDSGPILPADGLQPRPPLGTRWLFPAGCASPVESAAATSRAGPGQSLAVSFLRSRHCSR